MTVKKNDIRIIPILLGFLFLVSLGSVQADMQYSVINPTTLTKIATQDTFFGYENYTPFNYASETVLNTSKNYALYGDLLITYCPNVARGLLTEAIYKFNFANISQIITNMTINGKLNTTYASQVFTWKWNQNVTWNESHVIGSGIGADSDELISHTYPTLTSNNVLDNRVNLGLDKSFVNALYQGGNITLKLNQTNPLIACNLNQNQVKTTSESHRFGVNSGAVVTLTLANFVTTLIQNTDIVPGTVFDFESNTTSNSFSPVNDFGYDPTTNTIYPQKTKTAIPDFYTTDENNLDIISCAGLNYLNVTWGSINEPIFGNPSYDVICFNQSGDHNEQDGWYGAIKVINNTNVRGGAGVDFDFYYALISPSYSTFSTPFLSPDPPQLGQNLSIFWTTSQELNTILYYKPAGGSYSTVQNLGNFSTYHNVTINKDSLQLSTYTFYLAGNTTSGVYSTSINYTFTVGTNLNVTGNGTISTGARGLADAGFVDSPVLGVYVLGFFILAFFTIWGFLKGGSYLGLTILVSGIVVLSTITLLPIYLLIPFIVLAAAVVVIIFRKIFTPGGGD